MSRRILHIIDGLGRTGTAKQLLTLAQGLVAHGFDVHVASLDRRGGLCDELVAAGIATRSLGRRWAHDPIVCGRLQRLIARLQPDVVQSWNFDAGLYARLVGQAASVRHLVAGHYRIDPAIGAARWWAERRLAPGTRRFLADSNAVRSWYVRHGLLAARFSVIPPGVPPPRPSDVSRAALLGELQLPADARLIGVVGPLVPEKRVRDLIWAADLLRVLHDNLRLLVIGDGPQRQQLEQYARMASDLEHIRFLGERDDVWRIMPHLEVLWNASEPRSHSIAILEAMAAGVPVLASDTPLNRELIVEGETGYLIPLYERSGRAERARHTNELFNDAELAARLAAAGRQRVAEQFHHEPMIRRYVTVYES